MLQAAPDARFPRHETNVSRPGAAIAQRGRPAPRCARAQRASSTRPATRSDSALAEAFDHRVRDIAISFAGLIDPQLHVVASGEEVWVAIATQATDGRFVEERLRDVLFGLVLTAAEADLWEPRADWPSGELAWFEVARLGLRESPS